MNKQSTLSIDIGGTKIQVIQYAQDFSIETEFILTTKDFFKKNEIAELEKLFQHIAQKLTVNTFKKIGISFNCAIYKNKVVYSTLLGGGTGLDLQKITAKYFNFKNFQAENDVICMANAELKAGNGRKHKNFLLINLGTGLKVVNCNDGRITSGYQGTAGEISQKKIWVSELNEILKADNLTSGRGIQTLSNRISKKDHTAEQVFEQNNNEVINIFCKYLADLLLESSFYYNPEVIVFAGSLIKSQTKWLPLVQKQYNQFPHKFMLAKELKITTIKNPASLGAVL